VYYQQAYAPASYQQEYVYAPPAEYNYAYPEEACDYEYEEMEEAQAVPEAPVVQAQSQGPETAEKEEFLRALRKIENDEEVVIKSTDKVGKGFSKPANGFRGSKYRGVSRNGNQWQVSALILTKRF
jgi:hypothetical protein